MEVTAGELFYGSDSVEFSTEYYSVLEILAEGALELAGEAYGEEWYDSMASSKSPPADEYHDEDGIKPENIPPSETENRVQRLAPEAE